MARTKGARDRQERKNSLSRNLKAHGITALKGAGPGAILGGISLPLIRSGRLSGKGAVKGALIGGAAMAGLNELAWQAGGEGRRKAGYGNADRLDVASNPQKYLGKLQAYHEKELAKMKRKKR